MISILTSIVLHEEIGVYIDIIIIKFALLMVYISISTTMMFHMKNSFQNAYIIGSIPSPDIIHIQFHPFVLSFVSNSLYVFM